MRFRMMDGRRIDRRDERFRISIGPPDDSLRLSIARSGVLQPLRVVERNSLVVLLSGWKRLEAWMDFQRDRIPVLLLEERDDLVLFREVVEENRTERGFNPVEIGRIVLRLRDFGLDDDQIIREYGPLVDRPLYPEALSVWTEAARLDEDGRDWVIRKDPGVPVLERFLRLSQEERESWRPFLDPLGKNKCREVLEEIEEIVLRDGTTAGELIIGLDLPGIQADDRLSPLQKAEEARIRLRRMRYPKLTEWERAFDQAVRELDLHPDIRLEAPPFFEDSELSVRLRFSSLSAFRRRLTELEKRGDNPLFIEFLARLGMETQEPES